MSFDGESGHWYTRDGAPCYEVPAKSKGPGGMRGVDLRWDRHLKLVPSVTTVLSVIAKPALTKWLVVQGILAAMTGTRLDGETDEAYIERTLSESRQQVVDAANEGTRIHDAIERHVVGKPYPERYTPHVNATLAEIARLFPDVTDWVSEKSFAHPLGFGGKTDLHSPSTGIVVDYKGRDGDFSDGKKLAWEQNVQLAAYQVGLCLCGIKEYRREFGMVERSHHVECANIFVSRTHPGIVASHVWSADDIAYGWRKFEAALAYWKVEKQYDASF